MEYETQDDGIRRIYRGYRDTEVSEIVVNVECPYCGYEWQEDKTVCGETYNLICGGDLREILEEGCGKEFEMHFDAD